MKTFWAIYSAIILSFIFSVPISSADYWTNEPPIQIGEIELSPGETVCVDTEVASLLKVAEDYDTLHICTSSERDGSQEYLDTSLTTYWTVMKDGEVYDGIQDKALAPGEPLKFTPKQLGEYAIGVYADDNPQEPKRNDDRTSTITATITALKVEFKKDEVVVCWHDGKYDAAANLTADTFDKDRLKWKLKREEGKGKPAEIDEDIGLVAFGKEGGKYTITAESKDLKDCNDSMTLYILKVDIIPDSHTTQCADINDVPFSLTADSYAPGGVTWEIEPSVTNGASISDNGTVSVGCVGGSYTIKATSKDNPDCFDTASLEVDFGEDITDFDACGNRQPRPCWVPEDHANGCTRSPELCFHEPCNNHDICYGTCNNSKNRCDSAFSSDMDAACRAEYGPLNPLRAACLAAARIYWGVVCLVPDSTFYEPAQIEACVCCD